jgi:hypothetical protein
VIEVEVEEIAGLAEAFLKCGGTEGANETVGIVRWRERHDPNGKA